MLRLRFELDHHINLRPGRLYPGVTSPLAGNPTIDFVVVREGTEGPYTGNGGAHPRRHTATRWPPRSASTPRSACAEWWPTRSNGRSRRRKHLTLVHKNNVLTFAG